MGWTEDLERLGELRDKGLLTDAEWEEQKRLLLPSAVTSPDVDESPTSEDQVLDSPDSPDSPDGLAPIFFLVLAAAAITSLFLDQTSYQGVSSKFKDVAPSVILFISFAVLPCLFLASMFIGRVQSRSSWTFAAVPIALASVGGLTAHIIMWSRFDAMVESLLPAYPSRRQPDFLDDVVREGFWVSSATWIAMLIVGVYLVDRAGPRTRRLKWTRNELLLALGTGIFLAGIMYPPVQQEGFHQTLGKFVQHPDFTAYTSFFEGPWESWIGDAVVVPAMVLISFLVVLLAPTNQSFQAGLWGMLYLTAASIALWIGVDAEGGWELGWSLGGWIAVTGSLVILLAGVLEHLDETSEDQVSVQTE